MGDIMDINLFDVDKYIDNMIKNFRNKQHAEEVKEYLLVRKRIDKVNSYTMRNDVQSLLSLDSFAKDKSFKDLSQDDMLKFEGYLEKDYVPQGRAKVNYTKKGLNRSTIEQYMTHIKRFYKYYFNMDEYKKGKRFQKNIPYPGIVSWISTSASNHRDLPLDKLISEDDLLKLLNVCENKRDQAMYSAGFYDAGLRISELISLNVGSVGFDKLGGYFILPKEGADLKTGTRKIRLFILPSSTQYLKEYLNVHPFKKYDYAPLFYSRDMKTYLKVFDKVKNGTVTKEDFERLRLSRPGLEGNLRLLCKMAGIADLTPHMLRHQSATLCSKKGFNEMELRIRYGWSPASKMPSRYVHLASKDLDDKIKLITGYEEPEEMEPSKLINIVCWNCNEDNVPTNKFCGKCSAILKPKKEEMTTTAVDAGIALQQMMNDPKQKNATLELLFSQVQALTKQVEELTKKKEKK